MADAVELHYPFTGRWLTLNSPADRVPSHGTHAFASGYAVDFVPVDDRGRSAPITVRTLVAPESPSRFVGFGRTLTAPVSGTVIGAHDGEADHAAFRGFASVAYLLTQGRRAAGGWPGLAGNHLLIESDRAVVALCHLQRGSVSVRVGDRVVAGQPVARCGNSGNSTEPHVHVQAMDGPDPTRASGLPITFGGLLPRNREVIEA